MAHRGSVQLTPLGGCAPICTLQLFLGVCTRWWCRGLNQRMAAPGLPLTAHAALPNFPNLPSSVPFQSTSGTRPQAPTPPAAARPV